MDVTGDTTIFEEDCDCDDSELGIVDAHTCVSKKERDFYGLIANSDHDLDNE